MCLRLKRTLKMKKIFIIGANGMLGNYVRSYLYKKNHDIVSLTRKDYDLAFLSVDSLSNMLLENDLCEGDVVINCAGVIPQSSKQRDVNTRLYFMVNSMFPVILSMICSQYNVKMIHVTTDCVYSGKDGRYYENSIPDETNDYGLSKSLGDLSNCTIIRTSIIGEEVSNQRSLLEWVRSNKGKEINGFTHHLWNGVTCLQLSKIIEEIVEKDMYWRGVRHIFSPKSVSKYELLCMINAVYDLDITINRFETEKVDKILCSIYDQLFDIPDLLEQINQMKLFRLMD